jgi:hypothetical protein
MTNAEQVRRKLRARIHVRRRLRVEYVGDDQERLVCPDCGWTLVQRVGGAKDPVDPALARKLIGYRGSGGGIFAECDGCTQGERDERYPKGWGPLGPQRNNEER